MSEIIYLDREGYALYLESIENAKKELRKISFFKGDVAIHQGDGWHDNPTFDYVKMQEFNAMKKLIDLQDGLKNIVIVDSKADDGVVGIGSTVTIRFLDDEEDRELKVVATPIVAIGEEVSINSPLGNAISGKSEGDTVEYKVSGSPIKVQILKII